MSCQNLEEQFQYKALKTENRETEAKLVETKIKYAEALEQFEWKKDEIKHLKLSLSKQKKAIKYLLKQKDKINNQNKVLRTKVAYGLKVSRVPRPPLSSRNIKIKSPRFD